MRGLRLAVSSTLLLFATALHSPAADAIAGGPATTAPWFVRIETPGGGVCSGALISPTTVLTAQHCVVEFNDRGTITSRTPARDVSAFVGYRDRWSTGTRRGVSRITLDPDFAVVKQAGYRNNTVAHDIALLTLSSPLPSVTPLWLAPSAQAVREDQRVRLYGAGYEARNRDSRQQRATNNGEYYVDSGCVAAIRGNRCWFDVPGATSMGLAGDSGGPWVAAISGRAVAMGVFSGYVTSARDATVSRFYGGSLASSAAPLIRRVAGIPTTRPGTIVRDRASRAAWLIDSDGYRVGIPDGGTYQCLTGGGASVTNYSAAELRLLPARSGADATCSGHQIGDVHMRAGYLYPYLALTEDYSEASATSVEWTSGNLPGATLTPGEPTLPSFLSWTPTTPGRYPFGVRVSFADGYVTTGRGTVIVDPVPAKSIAMSALTTSPAQGPEDNSTSPVRFDLRKTRASDTTPKTFLMTREDPASDGFSLSSGDTDGDGVLDLGETWHYEGAVPWFPGEEATTKERTIEVLANDRTGAPQFLETQGAFTVSR